LLAAAPQGLNFCSIHGGKETKTQVGASATEENNIRAC
jgi:hypothetical protein